MKTNKIKLFYIALLILLSACAGSEKEYFFSEDGTQYCEFYVRENSTTTDTLCYETKQPLQEFHGKVFKNVIVRKDNSGYSTEFLFTDSTSFVIWNYKYEPKVIKPAILPKDLTVKWIVVFRNDIIIQFTNGVKLRYDNYKYNLRINENNITQDYPYL